MTTSNECTLEGCNRNAYARGICQSHYVKERDRGGFDAKPCTFSGCPGFVRAKGLCVTHYGQLRNGAELSPVEKREPGQWGDWYRMNQGYIARTRTISPRKQETQLQHRHVMEECLGRSLEKGENIHHLNGDRIDNRIENLELWVTHQPRGQRPPDLLKWADEIIRRYRSE